MLRRPGSEPWYEIEDECLAASQLEASVLSIEGAQTGRVFQLLRDGSLYLNRDMMELSVGEGEWAPEMPRQILNIVQAIVDTVVSKQVEAETKVSFNVEDGDFEAHQCAEDMDRFCFGEFNRLNIYWKAEHALRDACLFGDGWLKWYPRNGKAQCDKVFPLDVLIDDASCMGTEPTEMYHRRFVSRTWALQAFPEHAEDIIELPSAYPPYAWPGADTDVIRLVEGWHLASDEGEKDGRHILCCGNISIVDEVWNSTTFPFSRIHWSPPIIGAYSTSLVRQLAPLQLELGKMMVRIQHSLHLMSVPRVWKAASTKMSPEFDNLIGNVYSYTGPKPEIDVAPAVNPEMYAQADKLVQRMYEISRQNPMQSGQMPSRFDSRPALREAQEIADQPHAWVGQNWQRLFVDSGKQLVRCAREIVRQRGSYKAFGRAQGFMEKIDWAECNLDDDRFEINPTPTSLLPTTVTGKRIVVEDLFAKGLITDPNDAWELLAGAPDVDSFKSEKTAAKRLVDKQIYMMLKKKEQMSPDECQDPTYAKKRVQSQIQLLLTKNNVPQDVFELLDNYVQDCDNLFQAANPPPPPPAAPPPDAMMGPPGAMPDGGIPGPGGPPGAPAGIIPPGAGPVPGGPIG